MHYKEQHPMARPWRTTCSKGHSMRWQDAALTASTLMFIVALMPTLLSKTAKPALSTSVMNVAVLAIMAVVYLSLSLWFAAATTTANCVLWSTLAVQTHALRR